MKKLIIFLAMLSVFACTESLEDKAARDAKEYTEKSCPTPVVDNSSTDSITFDKQSKTFTYYFKLSGTADNPKTIEANRKKLYQIQQQALENNPSLKVYKEAGYNYRCVYRSTAHKDSVLMDFTFKFKKH